VAQTSGNCKYFIILTQVQNYASQFVKRYHNPIPENFENSVIIKFKKLMKRPKLEGSEKNGE
jgi:hypothetical protein